MTAFQYEIDPSWVDSIEDGDYDSAARLYLEAKRDAYSPTAKRSTAQRAQATIRALDIRFPGVDRHAATATAEELAIVGDRSMRRAHEAERSTSGLSRRDRASGGGTTTRKPQTDPQLDAVRSLFRGIGLILYVAFWPWTWLVKHRDRWMHRPTPNPTTPDEEEIPF